MTGVPEAPPKLGGACDIDLEGAYRSGDRLAFRFSILFSVSLIWAAVFLREAKSCSEDCNRFESGEAFERGDLGRLTDLSSMLTLLE